MYISETVVFIIVASVGTVVIGILSSLIVRKVADLFGLLAYARRDVMRQNDLRLLIERAEAKGVDIPESLRSAAA